MSTAGLVVFCFALTFASAPADEPQDSDMPGELAVVRDDARGVTRIRIPARDGEVAWGDVLIGIAQAQRLDDRVLRPLLPSGTIDITRRSSRYTLLSVSLALPGVRMRVVKNEMSPEKVLEITIDREAFEATRRQANRWIRRGVSNNGSIRERLHYGLELDADWEETDPGKPLVIIVHGFNSRPRRMAGLAEAIRESGFPCGMFGYPNDEPIADAAKLLARELAQEAEAHPQRKVTLVTNSMGALVARTVVEDPDIDPGNVRQLIMIAPPNHGSSLARGAYGIDVWEHLLSPRERDAISRWLASIADGLAEANRDLRPNSPFLRKLNARPRNKLVRYSIILGTHGPLSAERFSSIRDAAEEISQRSKIAGLFHPLVDHFLDDLDEVVRGMGDGVVAVRRGRLEGVEDIVLLDFSHAAATGATPEAVNADILEAVVTRLQVQP
jgi:pimeloyl-ACP methyl ester carboxylesterase